MPFAVLHLHCNEVVQSYLCMLCTKAHLHGMRMAACAGMVEAILEAGLSSRLWHALRLVSHGHRILTAMPLLVLQMIMTAAEVAPTYTEALLHQHMGDDQADSIQPAVKHASALLGTLTLATARSRLTSPDNPARGESRTNATQGSIAGYSCMMVHDRVRMTGCVLTARRQVADGAAWCMQGCRG